MQETTISPRNLSSPDASNWQAAIKGLARFASTIFSPVVLTPAMFLILGLSLGTTVGWLWVALYFAVSTLIPSLLIVWMVRKGTLSDFHMKNREERSRPLFIIFFLSSILCLVFYFGGAPRVVTALGVGACFQALVMWLVTTKWKISGHSAGAASFLAILIAVDRSLALPAILILLLVMWARVQRGRHTWLQSFAGASLGFAAIWLPLQVILPYCSGPVLGCF